MSSKRVDAITTGLNTTLESFNYEVKTFWKARTVTRLTLISFLLLNIANVLSIVTSAAPGWGWTHEISGDYRYAGEYWGIYGVWFVCWKDVTGQARRTVCEITTRFELPGWFTSFQAMSAMTLITGAFCFVACMTYICVQTLNKNTLIVGTFTVLAGLAGVFSTAWFLIFAVGFHQSSWSCCPADMERQFLEWHLWYGFVLGVAGTLFYFGAMVGGIFETLDIRREQMRLLALQRKYEQESQWGDASSYAPTVRYPLNFPGNTRPMY